MTTIGQDYYRTAHLDREQVTLFVPISGRQKLWHGMRSFLEQQSWPHAQIQLVIFDTSEDPIFASTLRHWIATSDYTDVRHVRRSVGEQGLADFPRQDALNSVRRSMARIYNFMARSLQTRFVWVLEDDVLPPLDICEQLLRHFDMNTGSVSAPYRSRYHGGFVAWDHFGRTIPQKGIGVQTVGGNGFGCVIIRSEILSQTVFSVARPTLTLIMNFMPACTPRSGKPECTGEWRQSIALIWIAKCNSRINRTAGRR